MEIPIDEKYKMAEWLAKTITWASVECHGGYPGDAIDYGEFIAVTIPGNESTKYTDVKLFSWEGVIELYTKFNDTDCDDFIDAYYEKEMPGVNVANYLWNTRSNT